MSQDAGKSVNLTILTDEGKRAGKFPGNDKDEMCCPLEQSVGETC